MSAETGRKAPEKKDKPPMIRETSTGREKYCPACKAYHPATEEYFYSDQSSATGLTSWCREATRAKQQKRNKKTVSKPPAKRTARNARLVLRLDFSGRKELLEAIKAQAEKELREPEMQVLWLIKRSLWEEGY